MLSRSKQTSDFSNMKYMNEISFYFTTSCSSFHSQRAKPNKNRMYAKLWNYPHLQ